MEFNLTAVKRAAIVLFFILAVYFAFTARDPFWAGKLVPVTSLLLALVLGIDVVMRDVGSK